MNNTSSCVVYIFPTLAPLSNYDYCLVIYRSEYNSKTTSMHTQYEDFSGIIIKVCVVYLCVH